MSSAVPKTINTSDDKTIIMKLQKQLSKRIGTTEYAKYVLVIPPKNIQKLGWKEGTELEAEIKGDKLIIERED